MREFDRILLETIANDPLFDLKDSAPPPEQRPLEDHSLWIDREKKRLYLSRQEGSIQCFFRSAGTRETFIRHLLLQGFTKGP